MHRDTVTNTEVLVRELLKAGAAVVMFSTWGLDQAYINGADQHAVVAEYYVSGVWQSPVRQTARISKQLG